MEATTRRRRLTVLPCFLAASRLFRIYLIIHAQEGSHEKSTGRIPNHRTTCAVEISFKRRWGLQLPESAPAFAEKAPRQGDSAKETYHERIETSIVAHHQVVVAGGGPSGVIAALAAARSGADTLLVERYAFLGGNGTAGLMTCYNGFRNQRAPEALQTVKGIPAEYVAEIVRLGGVADSDNYERPVQHDLRKGDIPYTVPFNAEAAKVACLNLLKKEGVKLRLHSWVVTPMMDGSRVTGIIVHSKSGRQAIAADIVIDCTGDGDVAAAAGAPFMSSSATGDRMGMSLMYRLGGVPSAIQGSFGGIRIGDQVVRWGPSQTGDGLDVESADARGSRGAFETLG